MNRSNKDNRNMSLKFFYTSQLDSTLGHRQEKSF